jgi:hypothetical protein
LPAAAGQAQPNPVNDAWNVAVHVLLAGTNVPLSVDDERLPHTGRCD